MKIVFAAKGKDWDAIIDPYFGRAEGFIVLDESTMSLTWESNEENKNGDQGAGIQSGQKVVGYNADVLIIGGHIGPKANDVLKTSTMKIYQVSGETTVKQAYDKFKAGEL